MAAVWLMCPNDHSDSGKYCVITLIMWWCARLHCSFTRRFIVELTRLILDHSVRRGTALSSRGTCPGLAPPLVTWNAVKLIGTYHAILCFVGERSTWFNDCRSACSDRPESTHKWGLFRPWIFGYILLRLNMFILRTIRLNYQGVRLNYIRSLSFPDVYSNMSSSVIRYT